jgi:iron(III) transport system substrate-binding protein
MVRKPSSRVITLVGLLAIALVGAGCGGDAGRNDGAQTVTVYTSRTYGVEPVFAAFTEATGIEVRFTSGKDPELRERLAAEGKNTAADVVMMSDAANTELAAEAGLLAPLSSSVLEGAIPSELRGDDGTWFALSRRARVPMWSTERVSEPPADYADLGDPKWAGRLCLRPSTHPYTQSLVASLILHLGPERATEIVQSWVSNDPLFIDSDTDILKAIEAGDCDVALANSYYLGRLLSTNPDFPVALSWPEQGSTGAHVNTATAGVATHAAHPAAAQRLIEWLATDGQAQFAEANFEFPANPKVSPNEIIAGFGEFIADNDAVRSLGGLNSQAVELLSRAGYL